MRVKFISGDNTDITPPQHTVCCNSKGDNTAVNLLKALQSYQPSGVIRVVWQDLWYFFYAKKSII